MVKIKITVSVEKALVDSAKLALLKKEEHSVISLKTPFIIFQPQKSLMTFVKNLTSIVDT